MTQDAHFMAGGTDRNVFALYILLIYFICKGSCTILKINVQAIFHQLTNLAVES